ncbi:MAG: class I SAM-dependent methyltransferase [Candidatus Nitrotoga sp.]|nr:class I SAM-dependent methyltransferase [Candidatus Nitrotoga sp.]
MFFEDIVFLFTCDNRNRGIVRLNFDEAACLWKAVKSTRGPILEIGRRHGGSTLLLLAASDASRDVISVDLDPDHDPLIDEWFARPEFKTRLRLSTENSVVFRTEKIGLLFVDGDHSFLGVSADVKSHWPQLSNFDGFSSFAVFHDAVPNPGLDYCNGINHCPGVMEVCDRLVKAGCGRVLNQAGSILVLEKITDLPDGFFD